MARKSGSDLTFARLKYRVGGLRGLRGWSRFLSSSRSMNIELEKDTEKVDSASNNDHQAYKSHLLMFRDSIKRSYMCSTSTA